MAERNGQKGRKAPARAQSRGGGVCAPRPRSLEQVQRERDALKAELEAARAEIAAMRARQADVLNRIDWVIDSLNSLPNGDQ